MEKMGEKKNRDFKISVRLKGDLLEELIEESNEKGIYLSEYIRDIISERHIKREDICQLHEETTPITTIQANPPRILPKSEVPTNRPIKSPPSRNIIADKDSDKEKQSIKKELYYELEYAFKNLRLIKVKPDMYSSQRKQYESKRK